MVSSLLCVGLLLFAVVPTTANAMTPERLYVSCTGEKGLEERAFCHGYLLGHFSSVSRSPTNIYCRKTVSINQLLLAYNVLYVEKGGWKDNPSFAADAVLYGVWIESGFCWVKPDER